MRSTTLSLVLKQLVQPDHVAANARREVGLHLPWPSFFKARARCFICTTRSPRTPRHHALFVAINLGVAWGCWRQPRWFIWVFGLLSLQQLYSHGADFAQAWPGRVDWRSLLVLVGMPIVALALWRKRRLGQR
jgi:hypothetical protein